MSSPSLKLAVDSPWLYVGVVVLGAITFVTALAVNDLFLAIFNKLLGDNNTIWGMAIYSAILIGILIGVAFILAKLAPKLLSNV